MSNEDNNNDKEFVEYKPDPITPENTPEEFEKINNVSDKKQSLNSPKLLRVPDEFTNDRTNLLVRYFHANIKNSLKDPTKRFRLLENTNVNDNEHKCIWSNDPSEIGKIFVPFDTIKQLTNFKLGNSSETQISDDTIPTLIKPYDASATDYKTDPQTGIQHFPTECLKFNNRNFWFSDTPVEQIPDKVRLISFRFRTPQQISYICINFHLPKEIRQTFDVIYETDRFDNQGNPQAIVAFKDVTNLTTEGIQIIGLDKPILTKGLHLRYKSSVGAINYLGVLPNKLSDAQMNMFLDVNSNSDIDNKAFNNANGNQ